METADIDRSTIPAYEMLLTYLCQIGLASAWGWSTLVADPARAIIDVATYAWAFGDTIIRRLVLDLRKYVDQNRFRTLLTPLRCSGNSSDGILQIKVSSLNFSSTFTNENVLIWDSGKGSRMGSLLQNGKSKGDLYLLGSNKLCHFAAGAAKWLVKAVDEKYFAFIASDQVVCLSEQDEKQLRSNLELAIGQDADMIFFDSPPALSLVRLRFFLDSKKQPRKNSLVVLARDRTLLKYYGGAHVFQCVLLKKHLLTSLSMVLEVILKAVHNGYNLDYGVFDIAVLPRLVRPRWLEKVSHPAAQEIYYALCNLSAQMKRVVPVSMPIQVYNVNTSIVLDRLRQRIQ